jgi:ParB-like chromosome segregation protein Spo0J
MSNNTGPEVQVLDSYFSAESTKSGQFNTAAASHIRIHPVISKLFPIDEKVLDAISEDIKVNGFDGSSPVVLGKGPWTTSHVLIDGHTRVQAALRANKTLIPVIKKYFGSEDAALKYAIHSQRDRRNMTDTDILQCVAALDEKRKRGGDRKSEDAKSKTPTGAIDSKPARSSKETAQLLGTSARKVERARTVLNHADEKTKKAVQSGEKSINKAYDETQTQRKLKKGPKSAFSEDITPDQQGRSGLVTSSSQENSDSNQSAEKIVTADLNENTLQQKAISAWKNIADKMSPLDGEENVTVSEIFDSCYSKLVDLIVDNFTPHEGAAIATVLTRVYSFSDFDPVIACYDSECKRRKSARCEKV